MRFLGYFLLVFIALAVLRQLPVLGGIFRVPLLGFFLAAIVVSALVAQVGSVVAARGKLKRAVRDLGEVDTPQRRGKLGRLLLSSGRPAEAIEPLRQAIESDPETVDWHYRLGMALLATGEAAQALEALHHARELDESFAYGGVLLQLSAAALAVGDFETSLESLERFEGLQGITPESAFRKGKALQGCGRRQEARAAFDSLPGLLARAPKYQKAEARGWALRAWWAKRF